MNTQGANTFTPTPTRTPSATPNSTYSSFFGQGGQYQEVDYTCPDDDFDTNNLLPAWSAVCSACVEAAEAVGTIQPTHTLDWLQAFGTENAVIPPTFSLPEYHTNTPAPIGSPTHTFTPSITPTPSAPCNSPFTSLLAFNNNYYLTPPSTLYVGRYDYAVPAGGYTDIEIDLGAWYYIDRFDFEVYVAASTSFNTRVEVYLGNDITPVYPSTLMGGSSGFQWRMSPVFTPRYVRFVRIRSQSTGGVGTFRSGQVRVRYCTSAPTPTPTATQAVTPTPTLDPYEPIRVNFSCATPMYISQPAEGEEAITRPLIDAGFTGQEYCYRILPYVNLGVVSDVINALAEPDIDPLIIPYVDLCLRPLIIVISILGIPVDVMLFISGYFVFSLVRKVAR